MKKSMITMTLVVISMFAFAGTQRFNKAMKENLTQLRSQSDQINYLELGDKFQSVAEKNENRVEPLYYAAYCYILGSWSIEDIAKKTTILDKAKSEIEKAQKLSPDNDELLVLEAFYFQAMIMLNPRMNGQIYSGKATSLLMEAQKRNPNNPRAAFLMAQNVYYTPAEYGGGKEKALPLFAKAAELFKKQDSADYLKPVWGAKTNNEMYLKCSY
jgi:hypothetical protein